MDGAEYLLKHEEDTHVEGQVCLPSHIDTTSLQIYSRVAHSTQLNSVTERQARGVQSMQYEFGPWGLINFNSIIWADNVRVGWERMFKPYSLRQVYRYIQELDVSALLLGEHGRLHRQLHRGHHPTHPRRPQVIERKNAFVLVFVRKRSNYIGSPGTTLRSWRCCWTVEQPYPFHMMSRWRDMSLNNHTQIFWRQFYQTAMLSSMFWIYGAAEIQFSPNGNSNLNLIKNITSARVRSAWLQVEKTPCDIPSPGSFPSFSYFSI